MLAVGDSESGAAGSGAGAAAAGAGAGARARVARVAGGGEKLPPTESRQPIRYEDREEIEQRKLEKNKEESRATHFCDFQ
jgi:hypothetical protein